MASFSSVLLPLHSYSSPGGEQRLQQSLQGPPMLMTPQTAKRLLQQHKEWQFAAVFTGGGLSVAATFPQPANLLSLAQAFDNREKTVAEGVCFSGHRYPVTRFSPFLIICRRGTGDDTEGLAILKGSSRMGEDLLLLAVYRPPAVSASAVAQMRRFFVSHLGTLPVWGPPKDIQLLLSQQRQTEEAGNAAAAAAAGQGR
ncbi:hypothetical protein, conserved [Eimeria tenella]|uniref:Profilin n=1 Tax=Eimeria tenella TaxID=5802 RepID=U6KJF5_EIMTE|nr:hypothetical protein, conserved [Eimeria tenella]CDJ36921.1 hypothetical protein, conserved [Eimeria tenella]|eukprot:XP_013227759.1 hypothetical protein, conserved [Eimeria tenella]